MRKTLLMLAVLTLLAAPAMATIVAPGPAGVSPLPPYGYAVTINVTANSSGGPALSTIWLVVPGPVFPGSQAGARANALAANINAAVAGPNRLADISIVGNINYRYIGDGVNDYSVFVWGTNMWCPGQSIVRNNLVTVDSALANMYGVSRRSLARFLTLRLRGMAELDSMGNGWGDVTWPNKKALQSPWNSVTW